MKTRIRRTVLCLPFLLACSTSAQIYKWTDANGKAYYGDEPPKNAKAKLVDIDPSQNSVESVYRGCKTEQCRLQYFERQRTEQERKERLQHQAVDGRVPVPGNVAERQTSEQQKERRFIRLGQTESDVLQRAGEPDEVNGAPYRGFGAYPNNHARIYVYYPTETDKLTTTKVYFNNGMVVNVVRTIAR